MIGIMTSPATGSAHHQPTVAFRSRPPNRIADRYVQKSVCLESARIAALWRRVLADPRNYGKDPGTYLDTDQFTYYVSFLPHVRLTAYVVGWGPHTEQLINVASGVASYANGAPEPELIKAVKKAERKLGI